MPDDIEDLQKFMTLPETNSAVFAMLLQDCMADADQIAVMKVLTVVMREELP